MAEENAPSVEETDVQLSDPAETEESIEEQPEGIDGLEGTVAPEINQEAVNKRISEIVAERYRIEQERDEALQRAAQLERQIPQNQRPVIPEIPNPIDDDYDQKVLERDAAIRAASEWDIQQNFLMQQQQMLQQQQMQAVQEEFTKRVTTYSERSKSMGIDPKELQVAANTIEAYGMNPNVATYILNHERGPLITMHLSKNPADLQSLQGLDPMSAAVKIATDIAPKLKKPTSKAPPPPETVDGAGAPTTERGPSGATYE